ncbi:MAG: thioredoxin-like domain-containing protein [Verrucomicrobiales bacterium]|nr:thioredoxin-like domain-containing protein [Verrucomicrobiales bacterium]
MTPSPTFLVTLLSATAIILATPSVDAQSAVDVLPEKLEDAKGKKMESGVLSGKYIGLYFSAGWCAPCRVFTPQLKAFREEHIDEFEVVFVSFDKSNTDKRRYIFTSGMEWPSVPGARRKPSTSLAETYSVQGYPTLVILAPDGTLVTDRGVETIIREPATAFEKWKQAPPS